MHLDYGYPLHDIALDVGAFDVLVFSPLNRPLIAVEAKKSSAGLNTMLKQMTTFKPEMWELRSHVPLSNSVKKYRSLLTLRPKYFLAVAPDDSRAYSVSYPDDGSVQAAELTAIDRIPATSRPA